MNKELFKEISDYFNKDLILVDENMKSLFTNVSPKTQRAYNSLDINKEFQKEIFNFLFSKSKKLRPLTIFLIKNLFNFDDENKNLIKLACALELLHNATLIHDDIVDEAKIRRLNLTFNFKYNSKIAVLLGDYLLSLALKLLAEIAHSDIFSYFADNTMKICKGEINQFFNRGKILKIEDYIEKSKDKTSSLFMAGAKSALHLIDKKNSIEKAHKDAILNFILNFSLGFQIYDDILNFKSDFESQATLQSTEKQSSDIKNGIYTLPYLYISQQNNLYDIMNLNKNSKIYTDALEFSKNYLNDILNKAQDNIKQLRNVYNINFFIKLAEVFKIEGY